MNTIIATIGIPVIPERENYTDLCIKSLLASNPGFKFEILIAQHPNYNYVLKIINNDNIVFSFVNSGSSLSSKRNDILRNATGKYILFIDDDVIVDKNWLGTMVHSAEMNKSEIFWGSVKPIFEKKIPTNLHPFEMYIGGFHYDKNGILQRKNLIGCNFGILNGLNHVSGRFVEDLGRGSKIRGGEEILFFKGYIGERKKFFKEAIVYHHIQKERINFFYICYNQYKNVISQIYINRITKDDNFQLGISLLLSLIKSLLPKKDYFYWVLLSLVKLIGYFTGLIYSYIFIRKIPISNNNTNNKKS